MDLRVALVIICLSALAITYSEAGIPKCCITTKMDIPPRVLLKVRRWEMQHSNGPCDITALILYVRDRRKPICAHPKLKTIMEKLQSRMKQHRQKASF